MKPDKPYPGFPLTANGNGQWSKKIRGRTHYFGTWDDWEAALKLFEDQRDDLLAGREPSRGDALTLRQLVNHFLTFKKRQRDCGELKPTTFQDYFENCERVLRIMGKTTHVVNLRPADFGRLREDFAKTHGPVTLCGDITCTRVLFKFADDTFQIRVNYGQEFKKPSRANLRKARNDRPRRFLEATEIKAILGKASVHMKAMIHLGMNCGFGNTDCATLRFSAIEGNWIVFPRPKTGIARRCPLWPETVKALKASIAKRPIAMESPRDHVFITKYRNTWEPKSVSDDPVGKEFTKLLKDLGIHRSGVGFYALRHVFETIGLKTRDKDAVNAIMGHADDANDMSARYNEDPVDDSRLLEVTNHVRDWFRKTESRRRVKA